MTNWVKARAEEIRESERLRKSEFERKTAAAAELKSQLAPFWKDLIGVLQESVKEFNFEFPEPERIIDHFDTPSLDVFSIRRTAYPAVTVKAQLNNAGTSVQYSISRTPRKGMNTVEKQAAFTYSFADSEAAYADPALRSHEDVAKLLLDAFFEF